MNAITRIRPAAEPQGLRPLSSILPSVVGDLLGNLKSYEPLFIVRGDKIVHRLSQTACSVAAARQKLQHYIEDALIVPQADLVDIDIIAAVHLIHAIREAEGRGPTPPAANAMAAPERAAA